MILNRLIIDSRASSINWWAAADSPLCWRFPSNNLFWNCKKKKVKKKNWKKKKQTNGKKFVSHFWIDSRRWWIHGNANPAQRPTKRQRILENPWIFFFLACQVPGVPARPEEDRESEENPEGSGADSEASGGMLTADAFLSFSLSLFASFCLSWLLFSSACGLFVCCSSWDFFD